MENNSIKENGFTLLEVIISMAIIAIMSVSIYTGYMIIIRQTKAGQVKQEAALEGKKVIEALQATSFVIPSTSLTIEGMSFNEDGSDFVRYLNDSYEQVTTSSAAKYIERITITPTKATDSSQNIALNTNNNLNSSINKICIGKSDSIDEYYIEYPKGDNNQDIPLLSESESSKKMEMSIYLTPIESDTTNENIKILDYKGQPLISTTKSIDDNLVINFSDYKEADGTLPNNIKVEINVYNEILEEDETSRKVSKAANIYIEKPTDLDVDIEARKGEINIYNDTNSSGEEDIGTLSDIKVDITNKNNDILFTGYYKKNLKN